MAKPTFNFTKTTIERLRCPKTGYDTYKDTREKGLSLYITSSGNVTFFIRKRIDGRDERVVLGTYPVMTVEQARNKARVVKGEIAAGNDPQHNHRRMRNDITFGEMFETFMERYSRPHKRSWKHDEREVNKYLSHWLKRKSLSIGRFEIKDLHDKMRQENGLYQANRTLEKIRAIYNKAIEWGWEGQNPTTGIKKFKEKSRDRYILPDELPFFFKSLQEEKNEVARDYIWLSLLTGARKSNMLAMRWDEISWELKEWRIPDTKNGEPLTVALPDRAMQILKERRFKTDSQWVLPTQERIIRTPAERKKHDKHLSDPKKAWHRTLKRATMYLWEQSEYLRPIIEEAREKVEDAEGQFKYVTERAEENNHYLPGGLTDIRIHDIRRTFGSYQAMTGASLHIIGKSLGHKSQQSTQVYSRLHLDPVRDSIERAVEAMLGGMG